MAALTLAGVWLVVVFPLESDHAGLGTSVSFADADTDGDGITDREEVDGWVTRSGLTYRSNHLAADSDGDGLSDRDEAGPAAVSEEGARVYAGRSDPNSMDSDTDGLTDAVEVGDLSATHGLVLPFAVSDPLAVDSDNDGVADGDEYYSDMDPLNADTDDDGLDDALEWDSEFDPTLANADDDSYSDSEEYERGSNPLSYDLTAEEELSAGAAGLKYGDCIDCALDAGLRTEQVEAVAYLMGHLASGAAVVGDLRDFGFNVWNRDFGAAGLSALGLVPGIGDSAKAVKQLVEFARRGDRATQAVRDVTSKLPMSDSIKKKILDALPARAGALPAELAGGPADYVVYMGKDYVGITNDFARRLAEHAKAGRTFTPVPVEGAQKLTRGEARAIEQVCIDLGGLAGAGGQLQNRINSISTSHSYYPAALQAGRYLLESRGGSCPIGAFD